jgi:hypothetical protein
MCKYFEKGCLYMASEPEEAQEGLHAAEVDQVSTKLTKELRLQCRPNKYRVFLDSVKEGKGAELTAVDASFCQLTHEDDFDDILGALLQCENVTAIDLSYNGFKVSASIYI